MVAPGWMRGRAGRRLEFAWEEVLDRLRVRRQILAGHHGDTAPFSEWPGVLPTPFDPRGWSALEQEESRLEGILRTYVDSEGIADGGHPLLQVLEQVQYARRYYNGLAFVWNRRVSSHIWRPMHWLGDTVPYFQLSDPFEAQTHRLRQGLGLWAGD
ncbi:MAG: hypothetical protein QM518_14810 [Verrucomicrobiota bacterium]|nr:hypothetical protein [Verrucomicrobiota bacterium]